MDCYSCKKQKQAVHLHKSKLLPGVSSMMCQDCIDKGYEPRWIIVLAGRQYGTEAVTDYIVKHLYLGDKIYAHELIKES